MRSRVITTASAIALVDLALIMFAFLASGEDPIVSLQVWNLLLAIGVSAIVIAVNAWMLPLATAEQLHPQLVALVDGHYSRGVADTVNSGVVTLQRGNQN